MQSQCRPDPEPGFPSPEVSLLDLFHRDTFPKKKKPNTKKVSIKVQITVLKISPQNGTELHQYIILFFFLLLMVLLVPSSIYSSCAEGVLAFLIVMFNTDTKLHSSLTLEFL